MTDYLFTYQESLDVSAGGVSYGATLFAVSDGDAFSRFIRLRDRQTGEALLLSDRGRVAVGEDGGAAGSGAGGTTSFWTEKSGWRPRWRALTENYVQHYVYLTADLYEQLFGQPPEEKHAI